MVKFPRCKHTLNIGRYLVWCLLSLPLFWGCQEELSSPPFPGEYELMTEAVDSVSWNDWLDHWSVRGHPAMQFEVRALRSLLDEMPASVKSRFRLAWYRIGPDRWSVLMGAEEEGSLPLPAWVEQERSSYRSVTIIRYRTTNGQSVWLARRSGWQLLAFQQSLLQDALLAQPVPEEGPSSQFASSFLNEGGYLTGRSSLLGFYPGSTSVSSGAFAKKELAALPDFLREGRIVELPARDWLPVADRVILATGLPRDDEQDELFLWLSDTTGQWDGWWEENRREMGELPGFSHQGVRVFQVLDERWQGFFSSPYDTWMPTPYVVRFNDGWILSNSEEGIKRWMDYLLVQKTYQAWLPALSDESLILGWTNSDSEFGRRQRAKIGPLLPKGETWFWVLEKDRCELVGTAPGKGQNELLWQSTDMVGGIRYWQFLSNAIMILDQRSLRQWSTKGTSVWRQPFVDKILGAIQETQIGEEISWIAGSTSGLYAWDTGGQPMSGSPFRPSSGEFTDWTHRLGTDRRLYRFALESTGQIRGIVGRGAPATGWPRQVNGALGILTLRTDTEDALVLLGEQTWNGFTLDGYDRWEVPAPGASRQWVTGPESGAALIRLVDGRMVQLTLAGETTLVARSVDTLVADQSGRWVAIQQNSGWTLWGTEGVGETYSKVRTLPGNYLKLSVQEVGGKPWLVHQRRPGIWQLTNPDGPVIFPELPGRIAPLVWRRGGNLVVLTGQEDKVVAYQLRSE